MQCQTINMTAIQFRTRKRIAVQLPYLDSIRGLAALYVAIGHIWQFIVFQPPFGNLPKFFSLLNFGHSAVALFIVLSGYCLMLPVAAQGHVEQEPGWLQSFVRRRLLRIYPAYFSALLLSIIVVAFFGNTLDPTGIWTKGLNQLSFESISSHVLLMHNITRWEWTINTPMWSVALEWQIYLLFGAVIIPLWKRVHPFVMVATILAVTAWTASVPELRDRCLWFVSLFLMGNIAACFGTCSSAGVEGFGLPSKLWKIAGSRLALPALVVFAITVMKPNLLIISDIALGLGISGSLVWLQRTWKRSPEHRIFNVLTAKPLHAIGVMSYSIYLLHFPFFMMTNAWLAGKIAPIGIFGIQLLAVMPALLGLAWLSYTFIERPFMRMGKRIHPENMSQPSSNVVTP